MVANFHMQQSVTDQPADSTNPYLEDLSLQIWPVVGRNEGYFRIELKTEVHTGRSKVYFSQYFAACTKMQI